MRFGSRWLKDVQVLDPILKRVLELGITCRDSETILRASRLALDRFGEHPDFLSSIDNDQAPSASTWLGSTFVVVGYGVAILGLAEVDISNQFSCYEMNGLVDWLEHVLPSAIQSPMDQQTTFSNRTMQLASITSNKYKNHVQFYTSALRSSALNALYKNSSTLKQSIASPVVV